MSGHPTRVSGSPSFCGARRRGTGLGQVRTVPRSSYLTMILADIGQCLPSVRISSTALSARAVVTVSGCSAPSTRVWASSTARYSASAAAWSPRSFIVRAIADRVIRVERCSAPRGLNLSVQHDAVRSLGGGVVSALVQHLGDLMSGGQGAGMLCAQHPGLGVQEGAVLGLRPRSGTQSLAMAVLAGNNATDRASGWTVPSIELTSGTLS